MTLVALTGMPAAGKGEVAAVAEARGWGVHRIGDLVWAETERRGLALTPANVGAVANGEREAHGFGVWAERSLPVIAGLRERFAHVLIDGMRGLAELEVFRAAYGAALVTVAVEAVDEARLTRVQARQRTDDGDAAAFAARDRRELGWQLAETLALADRTLVNEGTLAELRAAAAALFAELEADVTRPTVFISYSHRDKGWLDKLLSHLEALELECLIEAWSDERIDEGTDWYPEIKAAMKRAWVAVCLISSDFLRSKFIRNEEIPYLLERRAQEGMLLLPILIRACPWGKIQWLNSIQMFTCKGMSLARKSRAVQDEKFAEIASYIDDKINDPDFKIVKPEPEWSAPEKVDILRLPATGAELFGRQRRLELLDEAWESDQTNIVSLVAWGGVGKSTLVNKWLERLAADNYRGARRVFAWSFYSQGTGERVTSADLFMAEALTWFGDPDPKGGSPWDKGQRLADLVRREKTLLLLDGMEPLQSPLDFECGKVQDPALGILITELARQNQGLCVITTREAVVDLEPFPKTTRQEDLEHISAEAGRALLRVGGVQGTAAELEAAARDFGGHALALNLLAAYLHGIEGHNISNASAILDLPDVAEKDGKHPRRVMAAFEQRFGEGPEVELLRVLGLFDRPADGEAIEALRTGLTIPHLTAHIKGLDETEWQRILTALRRAKLIALESRHQPDTLDTHPLVREHFGTQLREQYPESWRKGNFVLFEHYKATAKKWLPDTLEEMTPLFAAVAHGCAAGHHQEALDEVYWRRIQRGKEFFSTNKLGAFGAELAALSGFFDPPWRRPVAELRESDQARVLNEVGFDLRALGRLAEAARPMQDALEARIAQKNWKEAARDASNLSELHLTRGDMAAAVKTAQRSVALADRSGDAFMRMGICTTLANALHQAGRLEEAAAAFQEAEMMQDERQPAFPLLYSFQGYQYCDLLLGQGQYQAVQARAEKALEIVLQGSQNLPDIALNHLSLGRAQLLAAQADGGDFSLAAQHLDQAVDGLRQAGTIHNLPWGLLARAALHRVQSAFERARRDLEEAMSIATRDGMRLHEADAHLEYARLYLAMGKQGKARESLAAASAIIAETGYRRRDGEVVELEAQLGAGSRQGAQ